MTAEAETQTARDARIKREYAERQRQAIREQEIYQAQEKQKAEDWQKGSKEGVEDHQDFSRAEASGEPTTLDDIRAQKEASRKMGVLQRVAKAKEAGEIGDLALKDLRSVEATMKHLQTIYRVVNGASAVTVVGLILTFLILNLQLILGNFFHLRFIPKLGKAELVLTIALDLLGVIATLIQLAIFAIFAFSIYYILHPQEAFKMFFEEGGVLHELYELLKGAM